MAGKNVWRSISEISAGILGMHVALAAIYFSAGLFMGILSPKGFSITGRILLGTGIITLAVFCLSTQFHLRSMRDGGNGE